MINVTDVAIMTSYLTAWTNTHNALARKMKDRNGVLKEVIQMETVEYIKVYCCGDCVHYDWKKHRCRNGAKDKGTGREHFYRDCPLGIHEEVRDENS